MAITNPIRRRSWDVDPKDPESVKALARSIGEQSRDLLGYFDRIPQSQVVEFRAHYTPPLSITLPFSPRAIKLVRIRYALDAETAVTGVTPLVHFIWTGSAAKIGSIEGLTADGTEYLFTFEAVA